MLNVKNLITLKNLPSTPEKGEMALITDTNEVCVYNGEDWVPVQSDGKIETNLYDINATAIAQLPAHGLMDFANDINIINDFANEFDGIYFNLLCKELSNGAFYNTIFRRVFDVSETIGQAVLDCLRELGTIHTISNEETHIEIWVKEPNENMICLLFFNCDSIVIEVK